MNRPRPPSSNDQRTPGQQQLRQQRAPDGKLPINPSGGLIGLGHPVGATGVRMMLDAHAQVTGQAGACQVEGARRAGILNIGGSTTTIASFVVSQA
ncbi:MAG TPA: hypothetical protein VFD96_10360 [Burkholderiaceae bacterium]|nr:hypothetical protein [Burkholderiaceae bacterium]